MGIQERTTKNPCEVMKNKVKKGNKHEFAFA
jgi:hypothetical protein